MNKFWLEKLTDDNILMGFITALILNEAVAFQKGF